LAHFGLKGGVFISQPNFEAPDLLKEIFFLRK
jgi:hypothetical protein